MAGFRFCAAGVAALAAATGPAELPFRTVSRIMGDIDILISWRRPSPDCPNPGTHLVNVKWKYKCKKNIAKDGTTCCSGEATPFTVTIE